MYQTLRLDREMALLLVAVVAVWSVLQGASAQGRRFIGCIPRSLAEWMAALKVKSCSYCASLVPKPPPRFCCLAAVEKDFSPRLRDKI